MPGMAGFVKSKVNTKQGPGQGHINIKLEPELEVERMNGMSNRLFRSTLTCKY